MLVYLLFVLGFIFLVKGAQIFVDGASSLARYFSVSELTIGLTIVAFGTSMPELVVMLLSNWQGVSNIGLGATIGSTLGNILLIAGVVTIIRPLRVNPSLERFQLPLCIVVCLLLVAAANDFFISSASDMSIGLLDGILLLSIFASFMYMTIGTSHKNIKIEKSVTQKKIPLVQTSLQTVLGIGALTVGGHWIVGGALEISELLNISETFIGLIIVSVGTLMPELITSVIASVRHHSDLALGNIFGSVIFNLGFIIGISALIKPITYASSFNINLAILVCAILLLTYFLYTGKKQRYLERWEGIALLCGYLIYIAAATLQ
jgi:cation:H+ antiporter